MRHPASARPAGGARSSLPHLEVPTRGDGGPRDGRQSLRGRRSLAIILLLVADVALGQTSFPPPSPAGRSGAAAAWQRYATRSHALLSSLNQHDTAELPAAPAGVADLRFAEFFGPIGDRGLEYSAKLRALDGRIVRLSGYMIREPARAGGVFRLAGWPLTVETQGPCISDTAPPTAVHVIVTGTASRPIAYRPGRLVLIGRLELGSRLEADGRNSAVRLFLEAGAAAAFPAAGEPVP